MPAFFALIALLLTTIPSHAAPAQAKLPRFLTGGDVSLLAREEQLGAIYKDNGIAEHPLQIFKRAGWNCLRLRLWVHPTGQGIFVNDLPYTIALGRRIKQAGFTLLLDLHYSDTWADPGHQVKPAAWASLPLPQLTQQVQSYTDQVITAMRKGGAMPDIVAVGNEISSGMLWPDGKVEQADGWAHLATLLRAGIAGVQQGAVGEPMPRIMIHINNGADQGLVQWFFDHLEAQKPAVPFDIIGLSYYPDGTNPLSQLQKSLAATAQRYHKPIIIAETAFPYRGQADAAKQPVYTKYGLTPQGQDAFLRDLMKTVQAVPEGLGQGVIYWEPEWVPLPHLFSNWGDKALFDTNFNALPGIEALHK